MSESNHRPLDIAREALRRLAVERVPPTPNNYRAFYCEIDGTQSEDNFPERALKLIAAALPRNTLTRLRDMLVGFIDRLVPDEDPYCAIDRADKAMYAAKRAGKNRAFLAA